MCLFHHFAKYRTPLINPCDPLKAQSILHTAFHQPEFPQGATAGANGHQNVHLNFTSRGQPGPLDPDLSGRAKRRLIPECARQSAVSISVCSHQGLSRVHMKLLTATFN